MKSKAANIALAVSRCIYGFFFIVDGGLRIVGSIQGKYIPFAQPAADAFTRALWETGYMNPLLGVSFVVAGLLLFANRTAPLGIAILLPSIIVIFFFHLFLTGQWAWGTGHLVYMLLLLWLYRQAFKPLWNFKGGTA